MGNQHVPPTAGIYLRVSTGEQSVETQRPDLEKLAQDRGWQVRWYEDTASGVRERPALGRLLADAKRGELSVVAVWAIDRIGRSMAEVVRIVGDLDQLGVRVVSVREPWLDTGGPTRGLLLAIMSWVAEQERVRLVERTRAGLERARRRGKRIGRPPGSGILVRAAADLVAGGMSIRAASRAKGVSKSALARFLALRAGAPAGQRKAARACGPALPATS